MGRGSARKVEGGGGAQLNWCPGVRRRHQESPTHSHAAVGPIEMRTENALSASATWNFLAEVGAESGLELVRKTA